MIEVNKMTYAEGKLMTIIEFVLHFIFLEIRRFQIFFADSDSNADSDAFWIFNFQFLRLIAIVIIANYIV